MGAEACLPRPEWGGGGGGGGLAAAEGGCVTVDSLLADKGPDGPWFAGLATPGGEGGLDGLGDEGAAWGWDWEVSSPGDLFDLF